MFQDVFLWGLDYALDEVRQSAEKSRPSSATLPITVELRQSAKARHFCGSGVRFVLAPEDRVRVDGASLIVAFTREQGSLTVTPVTVPRNDVLKPVYSRDDFDEDMKPIRDQRAADRAAIKREDHK